MTNTNGDKGYRWERELAAYFVKSGLRNARRTGKSRAGEGDIEGIEGWIIEAKDQTDRRLEDWLDQARRACERTGRTLYCVIHKYRGHSTGEAYVFMRLDVFTKLLAEVQVPSEDTPREEDSSAGSQDEGTPTLRVVQHDVPDSKVA